MSEQGARPARDLRMVAVAAAAWGGGLLGTHGVPGGWFGGIAALVAAGVLLWWLTRRRPRARSDVATVLALACVAGAVLLAAQVRGDRVTDGPVAALARDGAVVTAVLTLTGDPRPTTGPYGEGVWVRARVDEVSGRAQTWRVRSPVLVTAPSSWADLPLGAQVQTSGRLAVSDGGDLAGVLHAIGDAQVRAPPDLWWRAAGAVRASLRDSVADRPAPERVLVPALVVGDDAGLDPAVADDFRVTGLTHLLAVSGTNLTLVVASLLTLARGVGVRGRALTAIGAAGIVGFVLLARTEPSVLRAAVMGAVGLLALRGGGAGRAVRTLGVAVTVLLLLDPGLAVSVGFALSVLATAGILLLAPPWCDALARWLPRWAAEAVAVPLAAQLACTPVVAAISGQVSLVAVAANLLAAPVVGPATVLGLAGGLIGLLNAPAATVPGTVATWCVAWIVEVAHRGAELPGAAVGWGTGVLALALLTAASIGLALLGPRLVSRPARGLVCCAALSGAVLVRPPTLGWPPDSWVMVACDVGQGDGLVLHAGPGEAVVVDAGPDPTAIDHCLDDLGVREVPLILLTHFHADHVDGLAGVLAGRRVGQVVTTTLLDPPGGVDLVRREAGAAHVPVSPVSVGAEADVGAVHLSVLWPPEPEEHEGPGDGSTANESSVVVLAEVDGLRLLLTGDVEPEGQQALAAAYPDLAVDVLKVPHHGSRYQDLDWLTGLGAGIAITSVGADNDYGHPSEDVLTALRRTGGRVLRTDLDGAVAVVAPAHPGEAPRIATAG